ncbi:ABC transporter ATP-binding protein [Halorussus marinus]|uniref:ABC transporter ATP-binding protein n=1 Tax=Halorussus marinus TaxID=2505976 RepID=UPI00106EF7C1|nr:ABC transporter ATP-binding protein [Halorussus marinus]
MSSSTEQGRDGRENADTLLEVSDLVTQFETYRGTVEALDEVSLTVGENEIVGIVGESGCGKSVTVRSILQLIREPGRIVGGEVAYHGRDLLELSDKQMRDEIRGTELAMIFQNPTNALNPAYTVGHQIAEVAREVRGVGDEEARSRAIELMDDVGIPKAEERYGDYPHEFSGGMKQRVLIAKSLACQPNLLIADEPTTALDKTTEAQLLDLVDEMREEYGLSVLIITHDLRVISRLCDRVVVMYAGQIVETGSTRDVIKNPVHPYTKGLVEAIPRLGDEQTDLESIDGTVLDLVDPNSGCRFYERCPIAQEHCRDEKPALEEKEPEQYAACFEV